jgi:hypothetical protein
MIGSARIAARIAAGIAPCAVDETNARALRRQAGRRDAAVASFGDEAAEPTEASSLSLVHAAPMEPTARSKIRAASA